MAGETYRGLRVRRLADKSGERIPRWNPETGEKLLLNPATGNYEPWPTLGWVADGELPQHAALPTGFVQRGMRDGWITMNGARAVMRPGGPESDPWRVDPANGIPHVFQHADEIVLHFMDGDVTYTVEENPDKWHDGPEGSDSAGDPNAEVRHHYLCVLKES